MTQAEKYAWGSLVTTAAVYWFFQMRMLDGFQIVDQPVEKILWAYITMIVLAIIAEGALAGGLALMRGGAKVEKDERDHAIEAKANRNAFYFLCAAVNLIAIHILFNAAIPNAIFPYIDLMTLPAMTFALVTVLFAASFVKVLSIIYYYRT